MEGNLKKGIIVVLIANIINLTLSLIRNFVVPKYLPLDTYADIKLYQLIISYAGLAALGFIDGMYLEYGGKQLGSIEREKFNLQLSSFRLIELVFSIVIIAISILLKSIVLLAVGLSLVAVNVTDFYKCFYQATGEFKTYSNVMNFSSVLMFSVTMLLVVLHETRVQFYVLGFALSYTVVWVILEVIANKDNTSKNSLIRFSFIETKTMISSGFFLMWGLLVSNFMTGMDRWCVKGFMEKPDFALYSFAASVEGFLTYIVSPVSITLYNYFCTEKDKEKISTIKKIILIFGAAIIATAFPVKFLLEIYLTQYNKASNVLFILFAGQIVYTVIRCFYINIYKAEKRQNRYFKVIVLVLICGLALNLVLFFIIKRMEAFAIGTLLSAVIWILICEYDLKYYRLSLKEHIYIGIMIICFILTGVLLPAIPGGCIYVAILFAVSFALFPTETKEGIVLVKNRIRSKIPFRGR